jgi:hypothetical protein
VKAAVRVHICDFKNSIAKVHGAKLVPIYCGLVRGQLPRPLGKIGRHHFALCVAVGTIYNIAQTIRLGSYRTAPLYVVIAAGTPRGDDSEAAAVPPHRAGKIERLLLARAWRVARPVADAAYEPRRRARGGFQREPKDAVSTLSQVAAAWRWVGRT